MSYIRIAHVYKLRITDQEDRMVYAEADFILEALGQAWYGSTFQGAKDSV